MGNSRIPVVGRFHVHAKIPHPSEIHRSYPFPNNADKEHRYARERYLIVPARGKAIASRLAIGHNNKPFILVTLHVLYV